jgi:hypothetical protein
MVGGIIGRDEMVPVTNVPSGPHFESFPSDWNKISNL